MKKRIISFQLLVLAVLCIGSCVEKFDVDLNSSDPQIVVEGTISATPTGMTPWVIVSKSVNFSESNDFPMIRDAQVELTDNLGNNYVLKESESEPGYYTTYTLPHDGGRTYNLKVKVGDKAITSESTIPTYVKFDSLKIEKSTSGFGSEKDYDVTVYFKDPANESNYYHFVELVNGYIERHYILEDRLSDGSDKGSNLRRPGREFEKGDTVEVIMYCIDSKVYKYFNSLGYFKEGNPTESATPANPETNLRGALLGYFSAHTYERKRVIVE